MQSLNLLLVLCLATGSELEAARRTRALLADKLAAREHDLRARVVALYKLETFGELPAWVDDDARRRLLERRGAARRLILRDLEERKALRADLAAAEADEARLAAEAERAPAPPPASLRRPVPGRVVVAFGTAVDAEGARLPHRGVELAAVPGSVVGAVAAGRVLYAGPVRGLGETVVVDHGGGLTSVTGGLARARVARGDAVAPGALLGAAAGDRIHVEIRAGTRPLDPSPLFLSQ
ncbi:MAG TPA: peptidoglycan DD-metalloendopeptidase family protein [Haliangiales bacterium]|nr:peptidoglycan DD-metalloendopeptidase family protein [Haliangiales bacterium]